MYGKKPDNVDQKAWDTMQRELGRITGPSMTPAQLMSATEDQLGNDQQMEMVWAEKAGRHADTYMTLLRAFADKKKLRLTKIDDEIYKHFRETFENLKVDHITEDFLKSERSKKKWRAFCDSYKGRESDVKDWNMGTLMRADSSKDYDPSNVMIVPRIQFHAIEIARNREGANDKIVKQ